MKKIYGLLLLLLTLSSCFKDEGNYDYRDITELQIEELESKYFTQGDLIEFEAKVTPSIDGDLSNYSIKWYIGKKTQDDWDKLKLSWVADTVTNGFERIQIQITDLRTNVTYSQGTRNFKIDPEFVSGYSVLVLSEKDGNSKLGFVKYLTQEKRPDPIMPNAEVTYPTEWKEYYDLYATQNNGEVLGTGPIALQEHFIKENGGQYCVIQKSGAVDVERVEMKKDIVFSTTFEDGSYPAGMDYISGGNIMRWLDVVTDQSGRIFTRYKLSESLYNSGAFGKDPVEFEGEQLKNCIVYRNPYTENKYSYILDRDNNRMLLMYDGGGESYGSHELKGAGKIVRIPEPLNSSSTPKNYRSFNDLSGCEVLNVTYRGASGMYINMTYRDIATGKYFTQTANIYKDYSSTNVTNRGGKVFEIMMPEGKEPDVLFMPKSTNVHCLYLAFKEKLYLLDLAGSETEPKLYFTADSDITSMHCSKLAAATLFIGTEGGYLYELDTVNAKNKTSDKVSDEAKTLFKLGGFDRIVDLKQIRGVGHQNYRF